MNLMQSIHELPVNEKLQIMEYLWQELSEGGVNYKSPEWHKNALEKTEVRMAQGEEELLDWDKAKRDLRKNFE